jgi:MFS family permease
MDRHSSRTGNPFSVLGDRQFRLAFIGTVLAFVAFGMMNVVQGVVAFDLTGKNSAVGFVFLGMGIPMLILGPIGGALSDRVSKRRLLMAAQLAMGLVFALVSFLIFTGTITILLLAAATLVMGGLFSVMGPTRNAWVGDLLQGPEMAKGVALQQFALNATRIVGPLAAGVLIAFEPVGTAGTYLAMAAIFAAVILVLGMMHPTPPRARSVESSIRADLVAGLEYVWASPDVRLLILVFMGVVLLGFPYQTILPGFLEHELGHPASHLGIVYGTTAIGGIATTLALASRRPSFANGPRLMLLFGAGFGISLLLLALSPSFASALAVAAVIGAMSSGFQMLNNVNLMERSEREYLGRVMAFTLIAFGLNSVFSYPVGALADALGERLTIAGLGVGCLAVIACGALGLRARQPRSPASDAFAVGQ